MESAFDPELLLAATTDIAAVRRPPIPAGSEVIGIIGEPVVRQSSGKKDPTQTYTFVDFPIELDLTTVAGLQELVGTPKIILKHGVGLQLTDAGLIDWGIGKNAGLRRMREALDMNTAGQPFSIRGMQGRPIRVKVGNRTYEGEIFDEIDSVAKV
jgi:hypothetical protein